MTETNPPKKRTYPRATAIVGGLIAGFFAGLVAYLLIGLPGFIVAFIVGTITGSQMTLLVNRSRAQRQ